MLWFIILPIALIAVFAIARKARGDSANSPNDGGGGYTPGIYDDSGDHRSSHGHPDDGGSYDSGSHSSGGDSGGGGDGGGGGGD
jgi:hypothetical protein